MYPPALLTLSLDYDILGLAKQFIQEGRAIRGITTISRTNLDTVRAELGIGEDARHTDSLRSEIFMYIGDRQHSISAINVGVKEYALDSPLVSSRSDNPTYAAYLLASFENARSEAVSAKERITELLEQDSSQG